MTLIVAHRGRHDQLRENTLAAFAAAREAGADAVELDVRRSADGVLVVHHDPVRDGRPIAATPRAELPGDVAELPDALRAAAPLPVNVEVKNLQEPDGSYDPSGEFARAVVAAVEGTPGRGPVFYSSFDLATCRDLARASDDPVGWLLDVGELDAAALERAADAALAAVHPYVADVTAELVAAAHDRGLAVHVWTVNRASDLERMFALGVDSVITDDVPSARVLRPDEGSARLA